MRPQLAALAAVFALLAAAPVAHASMVYPGLIQQDLGITCAPAPSCTICHEDNNGGTGTVRKPFGRSLMMNYGLTGNSNAAALQSALATAQGQGLDANGDGIPDVDALKACKDPNVQQAVGAEGGSDAGPAASSTAAPADPVPEYGCTFGARRRHGVGTIALFACATVLAGWRRRRMHHPPSLGAAGRTLP